MYHSVCKNLDERLSTILIFWDISKAFDRVWHEGFIKNLKSYGISGDLLIWLKNYLSDRRQFMLVNKELSDSGLVKTGVPQWSVLWSLIAFIIDSWHILCKHFMLNSGEKYSFIMFYLIFTKLWNIIASLRLFALFLNTVINHTLYLPFLQDIRTAGYVFF